MRALILIRIVHSSADMGSLSRELKDEAVMKLGRERWEENQRLIEEFWDDVEKEIQGIKVDHSRLRLYQDGLPCGGDLGMKIVEDTAAKGSRNFQILRTLIERGAHLEMTESPELLKKEYEHIKPVLTAVTAEEREEAARRYSCVKDELIIERDRFIAERIDGSLKDGEVGILFIGAHHNVASKLPQDIKLISTK